MTLPHLARHADQFGDAGLVFLWLGEPYGHVTRTAEVEAGRDLASKVGVEPRPHVLKPRAAGVALRDQALLVPPKLSVGPMHADVPARIDPRRVLVSLFLLPTPVVEPLPKSVSISASRCELCRCRC